MRDSYAGTSPAFAAWKARKPYDRSAADSAWPAVVRSVISNGADVRRARIVSEPITGVPQITRDLVLRKLR
jgi:hypothetical protein